MSLSAPFIRRPVATTLLTLAIALLGALAYRLLPIAPLPQVEFPTLQVEASLPGASPITMASAVATPLERQFGRIAGVTEMTSESTLGKANVTLQFDLNREINAAARDVQAAINAASGNLPNNLPSAPSYKKVNPADSPILIIGMTSDLVSRAQMYDMATTLLQQKIAQVKGVGQVNVWGGAMPAVRVEADPAALNAKGLGLEEVRFLLQGANINRPKGDFSNGQQSWSLATTDQMLKANQFSELILSYKSGSALKLSDVAKVSDDVENMRNAGLINGKPAIMVAVFRQPDANIIETVDRVRTELPELTHLLPPTVSLQVVVDSTRTVRASVKDVQFSLMISIGLVILVVFVFLRSLRSTMIPAVAVPISLIGTFGAMYMFGYTLDNLSLMALTVATGFVVDDAIVVVENITRHLEEGMKPMQAAFYGAKEIGSTVVSISISLIAVFIPILLMGGIVGRLFREFAVVLSIAILISMVVSLTTTPMMCSRLLKSQEEVHHGKLFQASERIFTWIMKRYETSLTWVMRHHVLTLVVALATMAATVVLYIVVPKGFFPQQDTARLMGRIQGPQDVSFKTMEKHLTAFSQIIMEDPAVEGVAAFTGGNNGGRAFVALKPNEERKDNADQVIARLRGKTSKIPGANLFLQSAQDLRIGGRGGAAQYQYTLQGDDARELYDWAPKVLQKLRSLPQVADLNSDLQDKGLEVSVNIDRASASRLGISTQLIDNTLYDAFGQRFVSTLYDKMNQYRVVLSLKPQFMETPDSLEKIRIRTASGNVVPLSTIARFERRNTALSVNHQSQLPSVTFSYNLAPGMALGNAVKAIEGAMEEIRLPGTIRGTNMGTAQAFKASLSNQPILIAAALLAVYIVLGILYESLIHPLTILSTLPSAGVGALLALMICNTELSVIAFIGIILLIGIVKKNAILMIDFALEAQRKDNLDSAQAIFQACLLRFRPITMTTLAALLGGLPLALGVGTGAEMRRPLGIAIVGGLVFSQMLTLYTTPVIYLAMDNMRRRWQRRKTA